MKKIILLLLGFGLFVIGGCNIKEGNCVNYSLAYISSVNLPDTVQNNVQVPININFGVVNGCGKFGYIQQKVTGDTVTISVAAIYEGCVCPEVASTLQTTYNFLPSSTGTYYFKFFQSDNQYLLDSVYVRPVVTK
ncbi:MAG: hypothetical protein JXR65_05500 [Bacteroidales bacterium]|nr:hypothetical protein [Bacteroidales bacterium]